MAKNSRPLKVTPEALREHALKCAVLILAAGFEPRALESQHVVEIQ